MSERKDSANGSGANPSLDDKAAEELAAAFKPAWEVDDEQGEAEPVAAAPPEADTEARPPPAQSISKATMMGLQPMGAPEAAPAKKVDLNKTMPLDSAGVASPRVVVASPSTPHEPVAPPAPKTTPLLDSHSMRKSSRPRVSSAPVAVAADPFAAPRAAPRGKPMPEATEELAALVAKRPAKNYVFVAMGVGIAIALGVFLKFALSDDTAKPTTTAGAQPTSLAPLTPTNEIPPPPAKEDLPPSPPAPVAKADPPPQPAAPTPAPPPPRVDHPPPHAVAAVPPPRVAAPPPRAAAPPAPPPRSAAKPGTGGGSGGIVRDNPF